MLRRIQRAPFTNQINHGDQVLRFQLQAESMNENPNDTALQYQWAIARAPQDPMLRYRFGLFLFAYNRAAAAEQLAMAQPWDGFPCLCPMERRSVRNARSRGTSTGRLRRPAQSDHQQQHHREQVQGRKPEPSRAKGNRP